MRSAVDIAQRGRMLKRKWENMKKIFLLHSDDLVDREYVNMLRAPLFNLREKRSDNKWAERLFEEVKSKGESDFMVVFLSAELLADDAKAELLKHTGPDRTFFVYTRACAWELSPDMPRAPKFLPDGSPTSKQPLRQKDDPISAVTAIIVDIEHAAGLSK